MDERTRNELVRLYYGGASMRRIAKLLGVSRNTVAGVLAEHEQARTRESASPVREKKRRRSKLDDFDERIRELVDSYPDITAVRLLEELRAQGFDGRYTIVLERLRELRPKTKEPVVRFETAPGKQAQVDYSPYTLDFTREGRRKVHAFSYVLGYSRRQYLHFVECEDFATTVREHVRAFEHLGGVARTCLYDNMKVVVAGFDGEEPIYNTRFLGFATHYGFRPWACQRYRPRTKGKVERPFDYVEKNLLNARSFRSLEHLNEVTAWWLAHRSDVRTHRETKEPPIERWRRECPHLLPLPQHPFEVCEVSYRVVDVESYVAWRGNFYFVPHELIGLLVPVRVGEKELVVYGPDLAERARHPLFERSVKGKRTAADRAPQQANRRRLLETLQERFAELGERGPTFLEGLLRTRRYGRKEAAKVLGLIQGYQRTDVIAAVERAARYRAYSFSAVERILAAQAIPRSPLELCGEESREHLKELLCGERIEPRATAEYQELLGEDGQDGDEEVKDGDTDQAPERS